MTTEFLYKISILQISIKQDTRPYAMLGPRKQANQNHVNLDFKRH